MLFASTVLGQTQIKQADDAMLTGDYELAVKLYKGLNDKSDADVPLCLKLGAAYLALNEHQQAVDILLKALHVEPKNRLVRTKLADVYVLMNWYSNAAVFYEQLLLPDSSRYILAKLANLQSRMGEFKPALTNYEHLLNTDSTNYQYLKMAAYCAEKLDDDDLGATYLNRVIKINPRDINSRIKLANKIMLNGYFFPAIELLDEGLALDKGDYRLLTKKADAYYYLMDFENAVFIYDSLQNSRPVEIETKERLGICYYHTDEFKKAYMQFHSILQRKPDTYINNWYMGLSCLKLRLYDKAEQYITKTIDLAIPSHMPEFYFQLGHVYAYKRDYKQSLASFKKSLEYDPHDSRLYFFIATTYEEMGENKLIAHQWYVDYLDNCSDNCDEHNVKYAKGRISKIKEQYFFDGTPIEE